MTINSEQFNKSEYAVPMYKTAKAEHSWNNKKNTCQKQFVNLDIDIGMQNKI